MLNLPNWNVDIPSLPQLVSTAIQNHDAQMVACLYSMPPDIRATWAGFMTTLAECDEEFAIKIGPINSLLALNRDEQLNEVWNDVCSPMLTDYYHKWTTSTDMIDAVIATKNDPDIPPVAKAFIDQYRDTIFLTGAYLPQASKDLIATYNHKLEKLQSTFDDNVLSSVPDMQFTVDELYGLPITILDELPVVDGFVDITLHEFMVHEILSNCVDESVRQRVHFAYASSASDLQHVGKYDNTPIADAIIKLSHNHAALLAEHYPVSTPAEITMVGNSIQTIDQITSVLEQVHTKVAPVAESQFMQLKEFVKNKWDIDTIAPWNMAFFINAHHEYLFGISNTEMVEYFQYEVVLGELFTQLNVLFGVTFHKVDTTTDSVLQCDTTDCPQLVNVWDPDVAFYSVRCNDQIVGAVYIDPFAREMKQSGAWSDAIHNRFKYRDGSVQLPVVIVSCNFAGPTDTHDCLMGLDDIEVLYHEFGHAMHSILTTQDIPEVSGLSNVPWDVVELPSQFMENFVWSNLQKLSCHYKTGNKLTDDQVVSIINSKHHMYALTLINQIVRSMYDLDLHTNPLSDNETTLTRYNDVAARYAVVPVNTEYGRTPCTFTHIFSGGYSSTFYSYLWSEILSSHAYRLCVSDSGGLSHHYIKKFHDTILAQGGSHTNYMDLWRQFAGEDPNVVYFLQSRGIN